MTEGVDEGEEDHQKADFAVDSAEVAMLVGAEPEDSGGQAGDGGQQEDPPEDAGYGVAVAREAGEPFAAAVVEVYVQGAEGREQDSEYDVQPHSPGVLAGGGFELDAGGQHQNQGEAEDAVAEFESGCRVHYR